MCHKIFLVSVTNLKIANLIFCFVYATEFEDNKVKLRYLDQFRFKSVLWRQLPQYRSLDILCRFQQEINLVFKGIKRFNIQRRTQKSRPLTKWLQHAEECLCYYCSYFPLFFLSIMLKILWSRKSAACEVNNLYIINIFRILHPLGNYSLTIENTLRVHY